MYWFFFSSSVSALAHQASSAVRLAARKQINLSYIFIMHGSVMQGACFTDEIGIWKCLFWGTEETEDLRENPTESIIKSTNIWRRRGSGNRTRATSRAGEALFLLRHLQHPLLDLTKPLQSSHFVPRWGETDIVLLNLFLCLVSSAVTSPTVPLQMYRR